MPTRHLRALLAAALAIPLAAGLSGCDPDTVSPGSTSLTITPSLGLVRNATVVVRNAAGAVVGSGSTGTTGMVTLTATGAGPFVVEVQGDSDAEYFDENTASFQPFRAPSAIRALVPSGSTNIGVTGLTDLAHAMLSASSAPLSNANINAANTAILNALATTPLLSSILTPPRVVGATPAAGSLLNNPADAYAAILAGLADLGAGASAPALEAIAQLRRDVSDGVIDGMESNGSGTTSIPGLLYPGTGFAAHFQTRVDNRINTLGNTALQNTTFTVNTLTVPTWSNPTTGGGGGGSDTTPATLNPALAGVYNLTYHANQAGGPFTDGQAVQVTISSSGMLFLPAGSLSNPFYQNYNGVPHTPEVIWRDANQIEYALTDNSNGNFNEINVGNGAQRQSGGFPLFLGQLRLPETGPDFSPLESLSGSYTLTATVKSGTLTDISPAFLVGDSFSFNVASNGTISSARINQSFDPRASGATFSNQLNSLEPYLEVSKVTGDNGTPANASDDPSTAFRLYVDNGVVVGARLSQSRSCGSGCFSTSSVTFEARPINALHQDFIDDLLAANTFPQTFTVIERGAQVGGILTAKCSTIPVEGSAGATASAPVLRLRINNFTADWTASVARLSGNDALRTLKLYLFNIKLDDMGNVWIEERNGNNVVAIATNSSAAIDNAGCAEAGSATP